MIYRRTLIFLILLLVLCPGLAFSMSHYNDEENVINKDTIIEEQMKNLKLDELQEIIRDVNSTTNEYLPKIDFKKYLVALIKGEKVLDGSQLISSIFRMIFKEVIANSSLLAKLLILSIICAVLNSLQSAFESETVGELAFYLCYLILIAIAIQSFSIAIQIGRGAIEKMVVLIQVLLPTLITLLVAMGGITTSALFHPLILGSVSVISTLMKDVVLPLIFISAIIGIISKLSDKVQISRLSSLMRQISAGVVGVLLTIFIGIISIQGATSSKVDGVTIRTAKFAVDKFIPIVGSFLSDAMDTVVGCSMLLKNAIGVLGLLVLFMISLLPMVKIISLILIYKVTSAVMEPMSDNRIIDCLNEITKSLVVVFAAVASVGIMFFIAITIIISAGSATVMLR